jgi:glutamyl-tRNA synthetase
VSVSPRPVRTRVAPSPTGDPHVGTGYVALFNLAFARRHGGQFVLRLEDTDRARFIPESEAAIYESLRWLGLEWDEGPDIGGPRGPYRQSARIELYAEYVERLMTAGHAYRCWCAPERLTEERAAAQARKQPYKYDRFCLGKTEASRRREPGFTDRSVVRMLIPGGETGFHDLIRGDVGPFENRLIDDQVILKSDGYPTYHLAVVVDDYLMGITHVARGEEWISSTPKHILLYRWLGWDLPSFAHFPLLRNVDRSKLSKRRNPWAKLLWFRDEGFLPEALLNFLALMGWSMPNGREVFSFEDVVANFEFDRVSTTSPVFDIEKLEWLNGLYLRNLAPDEFFQRASPYLHSAGIDPCQAREQLRPVLPDLQERAKRIGEVPQSVSFFFRDELDYDPALLVARRSTPDEARRLLEAAARRLDVLPNWDAAALDAALHALAEELAVKTGTLFTPIRVAATGRTQAPPLFTTLAAVGREAVLRRLSWAIQRLTTDSGPSPES